MIVLLLLLGFIAMAAGMFGLGLGIPVRDTTFGAAVMVAASVAITGGFILVGLAAAVSELRRVLQHLPERGHGADRRTEPRLGGRAAGYPDAGHVIPTRFDTPETGDGKAGREEPPPPVVEVRRPAASPEPVPAVPPAYDPATFAPRRTPPASAAPERLDTIRPSDYRAPEKEEPGAQAEAAGQEVKSPPLAPAAEAPPSAEIRPARILQSGSINDVAYTLFSDGSIETPTPEGTLRFASIDDFRRHLEKSAGERA